MGDRSVVARFCSMIRTGMSVVEAASAIGVSGSTGYRWIQEAGGPEVVGMPPQVTGRPRGGRVSVQRRKLFWDALARAATVAVASAAAGVSLATGQRWLRDAGGMRPRVEVAQIESAVVKGRGTLTFTDRSRIEELATVGYRPARIARLLGRHRSTICRELARGRRDGQHRYRAVVAQNRADIARRQAGRPRKLMEGSKLREVVVERLKDKHSPEQIAARLRVDYPGDPHSHVSHETIYQALYRRGAGSLCHDLPPGSALRHGRRSRRPRSRLPARANRSWIGEATIATRPVEAADRTVPGHWEGDLVLGGDLRSALVTLFERSCRYALISRVTIHDAATVTTALTDLVARLPVPAWKSLTWDQGSEMAEHAVFTRATGCPVFFCDPHSPWQRPTNENGNGLIRQFFPKGTDFSRVTDAQVAEAENLLNTRPRKVLSFATPAEMLDQQLNVAPKS